MEGRDSRVRKTGYPNREPQSKRPKLDACIGSENREPEILGGRMDASMNGIRLSLRHHTIEECLPILEDLHSEASKRGVVPEVLLDDVPLPMLADCLARSGAPGLILSLEPDETLLRGYRSLMKPSTRLLSRVECQDDLECLSFLLEHADEIIIARGGMARNLPVHAIPASQRRVASMAVHAGVPFMLASDLLSSMRTSLQPTTADLSDIYTAVQSGVSSLMLTSAAALGRYPVEAMRTLSRMA